MSFSPTSGQVVLTEVFDEESKPTDEEIYDYAIRIGIDVETESHLLYLARDGLMQALPTGWKPCYDKDKKEIYYFNFKTKKAQWEHPLDEVYRNLVKKARSETPFSEQIDDDSRTSIREDLKSFEEASLISTTNDMYAKPKRLEPLTPLGKSILKKMPAPLSPIKNTNSKEIVKKSPLHGDEDKLSHPADKGHRQQQVAFDETEVRKRPNSSDIRNRRNIGPMEFRHLSRQEIIAPNALEKLNFLSADPRKVSEGGKTSQTESPSLEARGTDSGIVTRDEGYGTEFSLSSLGEKDPGGTRKELTLTGGGSVFLKSNKMKSSPSSDLVTSSFSKEELSEGLLSPDVRKSGHDFDPHPKSILRERNNQKMSEKPFQVPAEKKISRENSDEDRKAVRFNLEKELKISFEIPSAVGAPATAAAAAATKPDSDADSAPKTDTIPTGEKSEARQIEIDFDDLDLCLTDERLDGKAAAGKTGAAAHQSGTEPKKFKPSQVLVNEFREIFENQSMTSLKLLEISKKSNVAKSSPEKSGRRSASTTSSSSSSNGKSEGGGSGSSSHRSPGRDGSARPVEPDGDVPGPGSTTSPAHGDVQPSTQDRLNSKLDATFDELVDFAIKKKLDLHSKDGAADLKLLDGDDADVLLEEILKGQGSDSLDVGDEEEEDDDDRYSIPRDKELEYLERLESQINFKAEKRKEAEAEATYEKMRSDKLTQLENEFKVWLETTLESYETRKRAAADDMREKHEAWMRERETEFEKSCRDRYESETQCRLKELKNEFAKMEEEQVARLKGQMEEERGTRLKEFKAEIQAQETRELNDLRKSFEDSLNERKAELMKRHKEEIDKIERNMEDLLSEQKSQKLKELEMVRENEAVIEIMRLEMKDSYQKQKNNLMKEHELLLENMRQEHALSVEQLKIEFKNEEESLKKAHLNRLDEIRMRIEATEGRKSGESVETPRADNPEARVFEKVRCEKRLLEDKYKTLKEKYVRLKTEAKSTLESKRKKKESSTAAAAAAAAAAATCSETEKSTSHKTNTDLGKTDRDDANVQRKLDKAEKTVKLKKQVNLDYLCQDASTEDDENLMMSPKNPSRQVPRTSGPVPAKIVKSDDRGLVSPGLDKSSNRDELSGDEKQKQEGVSETKKKRQLFSRLKAASTSRINSNNKHRVKEVLSPVENLRRQLKKLEELEDQFPVTTYTDTYMRYPFTDAAQFGSSEIEFFKHRIHLERESVRRAKDSLKAQKKSFESRQRELKQKMIDGEPGSKAVIDQIYQEEKELTDMEVSVYRTRALLGEKIIRLRHLEQSLKRITPPTKKDSFAVKGKEFLGRLGVRGQSKEDERTLSDLSSYSGSSGFSSTDFNDGHNNGVVVGTGGGGIKKGTVDKARRTSRNNLQDSSEIIQSLENLNSEIREIWEVLKKQHQSGQEPIALLPTPPPLIYGDLGGWTGFTLSSSQVPYRNTVITTSATNLQRSLAQHFKTQVAGTSDLTHVSTIIDSSLVDRTRSLRDWLKAARNTTTVVTGGTTGTTASEAIKSSQVTL